jgi:hypothetical protein
MLKLTLLFFVFSVLSFQSYGQQQIERKLTGDWILKDESRIVFINPRYNHVIEKMSIDKISFFGSGLFEMSSGFFFITEEKWPEKKYPWIYCGNLSTYKITNDSLFIYHPGYKKWKEFKIETLGGDSMSIRSNEHKFSFVKDKSNSNHPVLDIKRIELLIFDSRYFISKKLVLMSKYLVSEEVQPDRKLRSVKRKLPKGYFEYVKAKITENKLQHADSVYNRDFDGRHIIFSMFKEGSKTTIDITGTSPDFVTRAIIPIIYCEDLVDYPNHRYEVDFRDLPRKK